MKTNHMTMIRSISWLSSCLVGLLALASFSLSFEALRQLAIEKGVVSEAIGWIFPLIVDGAIVVFSLCALRASLRKENTLWLRGLVIFSTCGSVVFNIAHVETEWLAMILAATPPVLLFFSFEALMHSVQADMERLIENHENTIPPETPKQPEVRKRKTRQSTNMKKSDRLTKVKAFKEQGMTPPQIVERLENVSLRTVQRDISDLEAEAKKAK